MGLISAALQLVSSNSKARSFPRSSKWTWSMNLSRFQRPVLSFCAEPHWCREPAAVRAGKNPLWRAFLGWSCYCWVSTGVRRARFILAVWVLLFSKSKRSVPLRKQACVFLTAVPLWVREIVLKATDNGGYLRVIWAAQIFISRACSPCKGNSTFWWTVSILLQKHPEYIKYCRLKNALFIMFSITIS